MPLTVSSPAFASGERIPKKYTREGENLSPPLRWAGAPENTRSFMLIMDDPDAPNGTFDHWVMYNIPGNRESLPESVETGPDAGSFRIGLNGFGNARYDGPEPPVGDAPHRYRFRLLALAVPSITVPASAGAEALVREANKHLLANAELVATYAR